MYCLLKKKQSELHPFYCSTLCPRNLENVSIEPHNLPSSKVLPASICSPFKDLDSYVNCRASSDCIQHFHHQRAFGINSAMGDLGESRRGWLGAVQQRPCKGGFLLQNQPGLKSMFCATWLFKASLQRSTS